MRCFVWNLLLIVMWLVPAARAAENGDIRRSVVRINAAWQDPNYRVPWTAGRTRTGMGAGFVIRNSRILTNAHVVSDARFLSVEKENDPKRYVAVVEHIAHDCDLAQLKVLDPTFFQGTTPLALGGIPDLDSVVSVYGYPIGGDRLSVTRGVVSRIDYRTYSHSRVDAHLIIQIDAAINPGNSGGPVLQGGRVVGVAFQGFSGDVAQNVGYMIPVPVVQRFLKDIEDGRYDGYVDLAIATFPLRNPAMRRALGLADNGRGVMVSEVIAAGSSAGVLKRGDVLLSIDGHAIASDGSVLLDGERVEMAEVVERKFKGDTVKLAILRDKKPLEVTVTLQPLQPYLMMANHYDVLPRYVVFASLLFQPLSYDLIRAHQIEDLRVRFFGEFFMADEIYRERPEIVVLTDILSDPVNTYLSEFRNGIVDEINGAKIRTFAQAAAALAKPADPCVIKFVGKGRPLVLDRQAVEAARERIRSRYGITSEQNLDERVR
ncbi:MAG: serine protease [Verrucomicrobiae bacterium]|nr:serine protease [Verrucomicrobiae bacterium]